MSDLYELTRKLVERGCPEHPRLRVVHPRCNKDGRLSKQQTGLEGSWILRNDDGEFDLFGRMFANPADARDLWTMHALRGLEALVGGIAVYSPGRGTGYAVRWDAGSDDLGAEGPTILHAIEAATRHLSVKE